MPEQGKKIVIGIGGYLILKQIMNVIFGAGIFTTFLPVVIAVFLYLKLWKYTNYAAAVILMLIVLRYLPDNLRGLPDTWLYLTEGILDIGASVMLIRSEDVKAYFNQTE
ncbi:MAG: hypothetical protein IJ644_07450 [Oscillospiraceae bacterium]|nr:hypothetical protein [Oscillospiraceae bacterium]